MLELRNIWVIQIPEGRKLFPLMTVWENLQMGAYLRKDKNEVKQSLDKVFSLFPDLKGRIKAQSRALSGGQQQMVAIARGIMANPELLLLDEPSLGLSPLLRQHLAEAIKQIHNQGVTLILVERNARLGLLLVSYGYVLENGELSLEGKTADLLNNDDVKRAYPGAIDKVPDQATRSKIMHTPMRMECGEPVSEAGDSYVCQGSLFPGIIH